MRGAVIRILAQDHRSLPKISSLPLNMVYVYKNNHLDQNNKLIPTFGANIEHCFSLSVWSESTHSVNNILNQTSKCKLGCGNKESHLVCEHPAMKCVGIFRS